MVRSAEEVTFDVLSGAIRDVVQDASGYNMYPAPYHRVFVFQQSGVARTVSAIARATDLEGEVNESFPNAPRYDLELLGETDSFQALKRAVQRSPRRLEPVES